MWVSRGLFRIRIISGNSRFILGVHIKHLNTQSRLNYLCGLSTLNQNITVANSTVVNICVGGAVVTVHVCQTRGHKISAHLCTFGDVSSQPHLLILVRKRDVRMRVSLISGSKIPLPKSSLVNKSSDGFLRNYKWNATDLIDAIKN